MAAKTSKVQQFILHALIPIGCSIVVGYIFYQDAIFSRYHSVFQFVWSAVVASLFYYLLVYVRLRDALLGLLVLFLLTIVTTGSTSVAYILRDIIYVAAIGASVFVYFRFFKKGADTNYAYSALTFAGIYGIIYSLAAIVLMALDNTLEIEGVSGARIANAIQATAGVGLWIGFAVGAGITLADKLLSPRTPKQSHSIA
jgi:hypothetical protein